MDNVDSRAWFTLVGPTNNMRTRNTNCKKNIVGPTLRTEIRKNFFSNRLVSMWNGLPSDLKMSKTQFKSKLNELGLIH